MKSIIVGVVCIVVGGVGSNCCGSSSRCDAPLPVAHALLGAAEGIANSDGCSGGTASCEVNSFDPSSQVWEVLGEHFELILEHVVVRIEQAFLAFAKFPLHLAAQALHLVLLLLRSGAVVDLVPVVPHLEYEVPRFINQLGSPQGRFSGGPNAIQVPLLVPAEFQTHSP